MKEVSHAIKTITAIITDEKYSTLQYQNGCSLSGAFEANLVQIIVIIDDRASLKLLTASNIIAIELATNQTAALNQTKIRLVMIQ
ncbi:hypothetical protein IJU97_03025 [bacterium]|nr:hypothetical protein [bacterium]